MVDDRAAADVLGAWPDGPLAQAASATGIVAQARTIVTPRRMRPR
jgi:hypothetical protein